MIGHLVVPARHWWQQHILIHLEASTAEEIVHLYNTTIADIGQEVQLLWVKCEDIATPTKPWTFRKPAIVHMSKPQDEVSD